VNNALIEMKEKRGTLVLKVIYGFNLRDLRTDIDMIMGMRKRFKVGDIREI